MTLLQPDSGLTFAGASPSTDSASCPRALCEKVAPVGVTQMDRRGVFLDGNRARVKRNQVDTKRLRSRSA